MLRKSNVRLRGEIVQEEGMIQQKLQPLRALISIAYTNGTFENKTGSTRSTAIPLTRSYSLGSGAPFWLSHMPSSHLKWWLNRPPGPFFNASAVLAHSEKGIDGPPETGHLICDGQPFGLRPVFL